MQITHMGVLCLSSQLKVSLFVFAAHYMAFLPRPAHYMASVLSPANNMAFNVARCSANSSAQSGNYTLGWTSTSSSNTTALSVNYMALCMARSYANCSASSGTGSVDCSANCTTPYTADFSSPVHYLVPPDWIWLYFFTTVANCLTLACYGLFSFLIGLDILRAIKKRATWLPSKAFSLTGVTVQIIVWWTSVSYLSDKCKRQVGVNDLVLLHQLVVSGKVALCVFIGYLFPGMTASSVKTFLALGISICVQIVSELLILHKQHDYIDYIPKEHRDWITWGKIADSTLFICFIVLGLILVCTVLGGQTVHSLLSQRTSAIFSITKEDERTMPISWKDFEDEVLSSWLVARVCQADYVISRSVFSSAVGIVVTLCVVISLLSNTFHNMYFSHRPFVPLDYGMFSLLFSFIIIGWIVICWRWLAAQLYFRSPRQSWRRRLCVEDFWTRSTVELIHRYDLKRDRQRLQDDERSNSKLQILPTKMPKLNKLQRLLTEIFNEVGLNKLRRFPAKIFTKVRLHKLIYLVLMLQLSVVFFSKLCGLLSEVIIGNFVYRLRKHMRKGHQAKAFVKYKRILELICMPGEDPTDLWEANEMSFKKLNDLMKKGESNEEINSGGSSQQIKSDFQIYSLQWVEDGKQLLNMLQNLALPSVYRHFPSVERQYVKITVVSLITILIQLRKTKSNHLRKVLKACCEVWDLISFTDECDIDLQPNEISLFDDLNKDKDQVCMAAEREFYKLQMEYDKLDPGREEYALGVREAHAILEALLKECEDLLSSENILGGKEEIDGNLSDSKDWMKIAPKYTLYKLCKLMLATDTGDFVAWTEDNLKNVISFSLSRLPDMVVKQCWKWAQEFEEDKIWESINLAGKCKGIMGAWEPKPKLTRNTTKQWTVQGMQSV